jgi:hypothetical protein
MGILMTVWVGAFGIAYLMNFRTDCTDQASRLRVRRVHPMGPAFGSHLDPWLKTDLKIALLAEPAPYGCPPLPFADVDVYLFPSYERAMDRIPQEELGWVLIRAVDRTDLKSKGTTREPSKATLTGVRRTIMRYIWPFGGPTPISWANKPFEIHGTDFAYAP